MRKKLFFQDLGYGIQMLETLRFFKTGVISKDIFFVVISPKSECKNLLFWEVKSEQGKVSSKILLP